MMRAAVSAAPPAAKPTTMVIGLLGNSCAANGCMATGRITKSVARPAVKLRLFMMFSSALVVRDESANIDNYSDFNVSLFGWRLSIAYLSSAALRKIPWANFPYGIVANSAITTPR